MNSLTVVHSRYDDAIALPLIEELTREYSERYGPGAARELARYPADQFDPAHGGEFLVLVDEHGVPVAGGAFMSAGDQAIEVKRVWTSSTHRRQGLARRVMGELEAEAVRRGILRIVLSTGPRQPEAVALYLSLGYHPLFDPADGTERRVPLSFEKNLS